MAIYPLLSSRLAALWLQVVQHVLQIERQRTLELHSSSVGWMAEREPRGMEERPLEVCHRSEIPRDTATDTAVQRVADDRVPDAAQVHADLVRPACVDGDADERQHRMQDVGANDACDRFAAPPRTRRHLLPIGRIAPDRRVDPAARVHFAPYERDVFL